MNERTRDRLYLAALAYVEAEDLLTGYWRDEAEVGHYLDGHLLHGHQRGICSVLDAALTDVLADGTPHSAHDAYWELVGAVAAGQEAIGPEAISEHRPHAAKERAR